MIRKEARSRQKTISAYLAEMVKTHVRREKWQKDFFKKVVGGWIGFDTEGWLKKERKASQDLKTGKTKSYESKETFLKALRKW